MKITKTLALLPLVLSLNTLAKQVEPTCYISICPLNMCGAMDGNSIKADEIVPEDFILVKDESPELDLAYALKNTNQKPAVVLLGKNLITFPNESGDFEKLQKDLIEVRLLKRHNKQTYEVYYDVKDIALDKIIIGQQLRLNKSSTGLISTSFNYNFDHIKDLPLFDREIKVSCKIW